MKFLPSLFLCLSSLYCGGQSLLEITYEFNNSGSAGLNLVVLSDSASQFSFFNTNTTGNAANRMQHGKLTNHASLAFKDSMASYDEAAYNLPVDLLIKSSFPQQEWKPREGVKMILGYACKAAILVDEKMDTTLVWYTDSFPNYFSKVRAFTAPGVVLQQQQQINSKGVLFVYTATKISYRKGAIVFPESAPVVSVEDWSNYRKGKVKLSKINTNVNAVIPKLKDKKYSVY